jgi:3',5'-nucleoside bisphosphate phosphatase
MKRIGFLFYTLVITISLCAQPIRKEIRVPNLSGFVTLKCDFHMHTVFSDGNVWPTTRVEEAWAEGLDAISITDHLEYTPHKDFIPVNHEAPYDIALNLARQRGIILIKGTEITKSMPPGHFNALFVKEATPLFNDDYKLALREAQKQGAFVIWNHPGWRAQAPDGPVWMKEHQELFEEKLFQGVEVANFDEWYPEVLDWAIDKSLTIFSNSDIHEPMALYLTTHNVERRPITLVFAKEPTEEAIREALFSGRTAGWFNNYLFAKRDILQSLLLASVKVTEVSRDDKTIRYSLQNSSDFQFSFAFASSPEKTIHLPAQSSVLVPLPLNQTETTLIIGNLLHKADTGLTISLEKLIK